MKSPSLQTFTNITFLRRKIKQGLRIPARVWSEHTWNRTLGLQGVRGVGQQAVW